jgi:fluoride exporter
MKIVGIAIAGSLGALARYGIGVLIGHRSFPYATMFINILGCFAIGFVLTTMAAQKISPLWGTVITIGFLGAFTTFSTFAWDSFSLARANNWTASVLNISVSVAVGIFAASMGYFSARALYR